MGSRAPAYGLQVIESANDDGRVRAIVHCRLDAWV
jgi:hypothetical protein